MNRNALLLLVGSLAVAGCKSKPASSAPGEAQPAAAAVAAPPPADAGEITGTVTLKGKAPAPVAIDMSMDPACGMSGGGDNMSEGIVASGGKLANVYVYVKSGAPATMAAANAPAVVLDQKGCRYVPHVIAVQQGGSVEFRNSDLTMHNIHTVPAVAGDPSIDVSQRPKGAPQVRQFHAPETMTPVRCNNHPWMNAFLNVAPNAFFAVTGADGSFTLKGLPPGKYVLAAVQEKMGEQDFPVTVPPHGTANVPVSFAVQ